MRGRCNRFTIDRITTQGKFKALTILTAKDVFPEPLEPAIPIIYMAFGKPCSPVQKLGETKDIYEHGYSPKVDCSELPF